MRELWPEVGITRCKVDPVRSRDQRLQLSRIGRSRPAIVEKPEMLGRRHGILKVHRRGQIDIVMGNRDILCRIVAVEAGPLYPGADGQVEFLTLETPGQRNLVGIGKEFVGVAEQAVKMMIPY